MKSMGVQSFDCSLRDVQNLSFGSSKSTSHGSSKSTSHLPAKKETISRPYDIKKRDVTQPVIGNPVETTSNIHYQTLG